MARVQTQIPVTLVNQEEQQKAKSRPPRHVSLGLVLVCVLVLAVVLNSTTSTSRLAEQQTAAPQQQLDEEVPAAVPAAPVDFGHEAAEAVIVLEDLWVLVTEPRPVFEGLPIVETVEENAVNQPVEVQNAALHQAAFLEALLSANSGALEVEADWLKVNAPVEAVELSQSLLVNASHTLGWETIPVELVTSYASGVIALGQPEQANELLTSVALEIAVREAAQQAAHAESEAQADPEAQVESEPQTQAETAPQAVEAEVGEAVESLESGQSGESGVVVPPAASFGLAFSPAGWVETITALQKGLQGLSANGPNRYRVALVARSLAEITEFSTLPDFPEVPAKIRRLLEAEVPFVSVVWFEKVSGSGPEGSWTVFLFQVSLFQVGDIVETDGVGSRILSLAGVGDERQ